MGVIIYFAVLLWMLCCMVLYALYYEEAPRRDKARILLLSPVLIACAPLICLVLIVSAACQRLPGVFRDAFSKKK